MLFNFSMENKNKIVYAYERKIIGGVDHGASSESTLYNHPCVLRKKKLSNSQIESLNLIQQQIKQLIIKQKDLIKKCLNTQNGKQNKTN